MDNHNKILTDAKFIVAILENSQTNVESSNIIDCIKNGADVNAKFANYLDNTPLHIAVAKGDKDVVNILLKYGARANITNIEGKTALALAKELPERSDIIQILTDSEAAAKGATTSTKCEVNDALAIAPVCTYKKRPGIENVRGQLYETKLLTLIYFRAARCKRLTQFYLGTNVDEIGDMDDVCLRFKTVNDDYVVFLQAKYKHNIVKGRVGIEDLFLTNGDFSLLKYFDSYRQIRNKFTLNSDSELFRGRYEDLKCYYVLYTTIKDMIECTRKKPVANDEVTDLIGTGEHRNIFQLKINDQFIELLTKAIMIERIENMGRKLLKLIQDNKYNMMLVDENIRSFHVMLAQKVITVSDINGEGCRTGIFREEFFSSNEELLIVLRETLYKEATKNNQLSYDEINTSISNILTTPEAYTISKLIGNILTYDSDSNTLKVSYGKQTINRFNDKLLSRLQVPQSVVNEAFEIAGRRKLCSLAFTLPVAFGNLDLTVNKKKGERRLEYLAYKISDIINESADAGRLVFIRRGMYAMNKYLTAGELAINGGIAGAVGNLLVSDDKNMLKFNLDVDTLGDNAKMLLIKLKERLNDNLHRYRFVTEGDDFPRLSFHATKSEQRFVIDFLDNLYFYTCQAKEDQLEEIETKELQAYECSDSLSKAESRIRSNALYLKVHNEIQVWWMKEQKAPYLTRNKYEYIFRDLLNKGLLMFINFIYLNEMYSVGIEFNSAATEILSVCGCDTRDVMIVIHTNVHLLTCHKLVQYFRGANDYIFLVIDYLCRMTPNYLNIITDELDKMDIHNVVIISEDVSKYNDVIRACGTRKLILVTINYVPTQECIFVRDDRINLTDLTEASQRKVLQNQFTFQGIEVTFAEVFDEESKYLFSSKVLEKIINKEYITLGQTLVQSIYEETKHYYVPRTLRYTKSSCDSSDTSSSATEDEFSPLTLIDHRDIFECRRKKKMYDIILILDAPGMGKSTLLTHLSLETKRRYPKMWIQRINLIDHTKQFHEWHEKKVEVDSVEALKFVCNIVLSKDTCRGNVSYSNKLDLQVVNDEIKLNNHDEVSALVAFELNTFLNYFKEGRTVFLFDGFDEICPHYKREVTQFLKYLARCSTLTDLPAEGRVQKRSEQCVWITSRPYNDLRETLEKEFGESYTLQPFSYKDIQVFLDKYLRRNLDLNALTSNQLKNIVGFLDYMIEYSDFRVINNVLTSVYIAAIEYFEKEIKRSRVSVDNLMYVRYLNTKLKEYTRRGKFLMDPKVHRGDVPLHVYFAIHFFHNQIKDARITNTKDFVRQWDMNINVFAFYERFIETKLKTIRFEEKNRMDIYNPDVKITYDKEKKEFLDKHKKLAFYAVCCVYDKEVLPEDELGMIKDIIKAMEIAKEKTGIVDRVVDGLPRFVHYTFAEYFAVEYIYDALKSGEINKQNRMLDYLLSRNINFTRYGVLHHFDLKIKSEPSFITAVCSFHVNNYILETLRKQILDSHEKNTTFFTVTYMESLKHFAAFLINALIGAVNESNFDIFMLIIKSDFIIIFELIQYDYVEYVCKILDCIRRFNTSKIEGLIPFSKSKNKLLSENNEEIIKKLRNYVGLSAECQLGIRLEIAACGHSEVTSGDNIG